MDKKKILVIQTAFIGDLIMSTSIFPALKELYPESEIDIITIPASSILVKYNPYIKNIYEFDKKSTFFNKIISFFKLIIKLRNRKYDIGISIQHSLTSSMMMLLGAVKFKVGRLSMKFVDKKVPIPVELHNKDRALALLKALSNRDFNNNTEIYIPEEIENKIKQNILLNNKKNICIAPGSVRFTKRLPANKFIELINKLSDYNVYLIGAKNEFELCDEIQQKSSNKQVMNYAGKLNLLESAALVKNSDLILCNDSSPLHIGNAVDTPVFAFFGPTVKEFACYPYRPKDQMIEIELDCRPCSKHGTDKCPLGHHNCMNLIDMNSVFFKIKNLLNN